MEGFETLEAVLSGTQNTTTVTEPTTQAAPAPETSPTQPSDPNPTTTQTPEVPPSAPETTPPATPTQTTPPEPEEDPEHVFTGTRQNQAFAQMRVQNRQLLSTVSKLSQIMGLPPNISQEQMLPLVEQRLLEIQSGATNIPADVAQRLEDLERQKQESEAQVLHTNASLAFQKVKDTYGLTQQDLVAFAQQLSDAGKNPYAQPVDLMTEYRMMNFDKIIESERKKAVAAEAERARKAAEKSTTPPRTVSPTQEPANQKINTVAGLNNLLKGL